ncbi:hypothetical protein AJ79_08995 [Helicocarpus griseus UAMH5409]|uniref:Nuclear condensin complex subunit 3 C-terminal domain-containing protein n=1 Tax=Helicocarpus griseus UAMH5409 TaxID=1447875 RepID=A0A2B7WF84_9EURO|nr:hypothetical protein AJ79_08995 [Helicocarpus griseus UAMH5409]
MPSRVSARASSATSTRKSSAPPSGNPPAVFIPAEPPLPTSSKHLRANIVEIFADAQRSTTGHRKLVVRLRKIQEGCCGLRQDNGKGKKGGQHHDESLDDTFGDGGSLAEKEFNIEVSRCMLRVLGVKKAEGAGDRVIKFLGTFLRMASEKDFELFSQGGDPDETQTLPETPTSRLIYGIVSTMIPLFAAKERIIRYRTTQIVTHIVNSLDSVDDELYHLIRQGLVKRIRDKEPSVRVQAVMGLGRLAGNEDEDNDSSKNDGAAALLDKLQDVLQHDTSAEVRRTLLLNLPLTPTTLPYLLERARDLDPLTRRALYSRLLPQLADFRHLSLSMREKLLRWGIRDRDDNVKKAAGRLFYERWIEDCSGRPEAEEAGQPTDKAAPPTMTALMELLERIDVVTSGVEGGIAHEAMRNFWEGRPDYREAVEFNEQFWESLTPESAFMARSFNHFCREEDGKYEDLADEKIPEVTALAYYLHKYTTTLLDRLNQPPTDDKRAEEETVECEFVVEQLLHICLTLDYSDEVGRRKMFSLLRETLAVPNLPEEVTKLVVEVLRAVCGPDAAGESEFCGVVLEAVAEVHDTIVSEDSFVSAKSEQSEESSAKSSQRRSETPFDDDEEGEGDSEDVPFDKEVAKAKILREIMVNMKCLYIAQCMLQNVEGNLQDNMHLVTMLNNLVVPAVRSHEAPIRERGLECLGLCCLLDKKLAEENMSLFIHCYTKGHEALQETAIRILSDILTTHHSMLMPVPSPTESNSVTPPPFQKPLLKVFAKSLKPNAPHIVQTAAVTALAKLLLTGTLSPSGPNVPSSIKELNENSIDTLLQALVLAFFHPRTRENLALRQALTYFLPVYCHSRPANAQHMCKIAVPVIRTVLSAADDFYSLEADEDSDGEIDESVGEKEVKSLMNNVVGMLVEWTDDRRIVGLGGEAQLPGLSVTPTTTPFRPSDSLHLRLMRDILQRLLGVGSTSASTKEEKKHLLFMLGKLHVPTPPAPASGSRAGSRVPEGMADEHESMRSSMRSNNVVGHGQVPVVAADDDGELAVVVKDLLDQAISSGVAADATGRNALVKAKNSVLKVVAVMKLANDKKRERETSRAVSVGSMISVSSGGDGRRNVRGSREGSMAPSVASMASGHSVRVKRERREESESVLSAVPSEGEHEGAVDDSRTDIGGEDDDEGEDTIIASRPTEGASDAGQKRGRREKSTTAETGSEAFTDAEG